eukprot:s3598_g5.t1
MHHRALERTLTACARVVLATACIRLDATEVVQEMPCQRRTKSRPGLPCLCNVPDHARTYVNLFDLC